MIKLANSLEAYPRMDTVARESCFVPKKRGIAKSDFFSVKANIGIFNENYGKIWPKPAFPQ